MSRTPPLYATGQWSVKTPFTVDENAIYTCKAIRSIDDIEARGIDPYEAFYKPLGISRDRYELDVTNLANIVTLMSDTQPVRYVPDTYIESYPDVTTVPYRHIVLSISLGAVPDTLVLDDLTTKLEELVETNIGIQGTVKVHQAGTVAKGLAQGTHRTLENNRLARIADNTTDRARVIELEEELERLRTQAATLEQIVIDNDLLS